MTGRVTIISLVIISAGIAADSRHDSTALRTIPIPHPLAVALRAGSVQQELNVRAKQIQDIEAALEKVELPLWRLRDLPPDQRNNQAEILVTQLKENLCRILSISQRERLNQIVWQMRGIVSFLEPDTAQRLKLSPTQITQFQNLFTVLTNKLKDLQQNPKIKPESRNAYIRKIHAKTKKNLLALLNDQQRQILPQLIGPSFDLSHVRLIACKAPPWQPVEAWINADESQISATRKGKVTVVHFYAFGCINCKRTLPYYNEWVKQFPASQFQIIGIHRPETKQERILEKVKQKAAEFHMQYPIAVDNQSLNWDAWANRMWPSMYLVDRKGFVRYWWYGELNYQGEPSEKWMKDKIQELLKEKPSPPS